MLTVSAWGQLAREPHLDFLLKRLDSSMFLLGNFEAFGHVRGKHVNSGNFYSVLDGDKITAVFCVTSSGNLLLQADDDSVNQDLLTIVVRTSLQESVQIKGVLGPWMFASEIWAHLKEMGVVGQPSFYSKELLYSLPNLIECCEVDASGIQYLGLNHFEKWKALRLCYLEEQGLRQNLSKDEFYNSFLSLVERKMVWGDFDTDELIAMVGLNSKALNIGQVGGVFVTPEMRKKGVASRAMKAMHNDCLKDHAIKRLILFTDQPNVAAQALYQSLGYQHVGFYGLIFS